MTTTTTSAVIDGGALAAEADRISHHPAIVEMAHGLIATGQHRDIMFAAPDALPFDFINAANREANRRGVGQLRIGAPARAVRAALFDIVFPR